MNAGDIFGPYRLVSKLGEGGMGEVYRARDTRLNRDAALKVLPAAFTRDRDRLARFEREAQLLAQLHHPNIATVFGLEESGGIRALAMELVEGEDLSARIARGPLPVEDALAIARQIADAIEAAHEHGIVHRDLKPANIKVRPDGAVKVLDFGLAKGLAGSVEAVGRGGTELSPAMSPTFTAGVFARGSGGADTELGMIIGTAAYMAPEQARGRAVDRRADIWAFGVILYEMLTGRRAFAGDETSDVLASVLKTDPDLSGVPASVPANVRRLLRRCLQKDPRRRLSAIGDARLELEDEDLQSHTPAASSPSGRRLVTLLWPALAGVALSAAAAWAAWPPAAPTVERNVVRTSLLSAPGIEMYPDSSMVAISPDGRMIAYVVGTVSASFNTQLWVRSLDSTTARRIEAGDGATLPFWSYDSQRIGFFTTDKLKTVAASGGRAQDLCLASEGRGGTWNRDNVIVFAPDAGGPLYRIPASGGTPAPVTTLDASRKEYGHRMPSFLPDGKHFVYAGLPGRDGTFDIYVGSLDDAAARTHVGAMESTPAFAAPRWLLYARQGGLVAQEFDPDIRKIVGDPIPLPDEPTTVVDPEVSFTAGRAIASSRTNTLAYFSSPSINTILEWYDLTGTPTGNRLNVPAGHYDTVRISPDGTRAALVRSSSPSESNLWLADLARGTAAPLTTGRGRYDAPVWSPDSRRIAFVADREGPQQVFGLQIDERTAEAPIYRSDANFKVPRSWSPDGRWLVLSQLDQDSGQNVWRVGATGADAGVLVQSPETDQGGPVSPDGRWLAFFSEDTGRGELYVQPFGAAGRRVQVSQQGALWAWWTPAGDAILFLDQDKRTLWRVRVTDRAAMQVTAPVRIGTFPSGVVSLDAAPDRKRFLVITPERLGPGSITIVQNWLAALPGSGTK